MGEYPSKDFAVRLWDGTIWSENSQQSEQHPALTLVLSHPGSLLSMLLPPTEFILGEAYIYGNFDMEGDLMAAFSQHYVFPDGELVPISVSLSAAEAAGFEIRDFESLRELYPSHCAIGFGGWKTIMSRLYALWMKLHTASGGFLCPVRLMGLKLVGTMSINRCWSNPRTTEVAVCPSLELIYTKAMVAPDSMRSLNQKDYNQNKPI